MLNQLLIEFYDKMSSWEQSVVKETKYSLAQIHTIEVLGTFGAMKMKELADRLGITTGTLTVQVDKLVAANLIKRQTMDNDRRVIVVTLTKTGQAIHQQHHQFHMDLVNNLTQRIEQQDEELLIRCLTSMNKEF